MESPSGALIENFLSVSPVLKDAERAYGAFAEAKLF
jgi:hypothetical protein